MDQAVYNNVARYIIIYALTFLSRAFHSTGRKAVSQTLPQSPQVCTRCKSLLYQGQRFCPNCGMPAQESSAPTVAASLSPNTPSTSTPYPNSTLFTGPQSNQTPYPNTPSANPSYGLDYRQSVSGLNQSGFQQPTMAGSKGYQQLPITGASGYTQPDIPAVAQNMTAPPPPSSYAPPPPTDPYGAPPVSAYGTGSPPDPYKVGYGMPIQAKRRSPLVPIVIGVVILLILACSGGVFALGNGLSTFSKALGGSSGGSLTSGSTPRVQNVNLTITYASDQISITSLQEADKFADDTYTNFYGTRSNYVRINFKEQQTATKSSFFSYRETFHLILPDKSVLSPENEQAYIAPEQSVIRTNWVDFATNTQVDLTQLALRLGAGDEAQMEFPLKTGADVSKFQPKTTTLNKPFQYAGLNWTMKSASQGLYAEGKQAKTGQVYVSLLLTTDNPTDNIVVIYDKVRLKAGGMVISPDYASNSEKINFIAPHTSGLQGTLIFMIQPTNGTYTLDLLGSSDSSNPFNEQTIDFQIA